MMEVIPTIMIKQNDRIMVKSPWYIVPTPSMNRYWAGGSFTPLPYSVQALDV
jgi:hypothetical protein